MTLRWRVYYTGGATFDRRDGTAFEAPARGVLMIANSDPEHGWALARGTDYYWWLPDDTWEGGDIFGLFDYLIEPGVKRVLFGRTTTTAEFQAVLRRAIDDPDIPQKSGWQAREQKRGGLTSPDGDSPL